MAYCPSGFVEGVFVEVLWDVERCNVEGRREGERVVESVWWRGKVMNVITDRGVTVAKIRYDRMGDFAEQVGEVQVFPSHMQVVGADDVTQLRWRFYESSGDVTYITEAGVEVPGEARLCQTEDEQHMLRLISLENKMEDMAFKYDELARRLLSQQDIMVGLSGRESRTDLCYERLFALLRHKLAVMVQKPLHAYRHRNENHEASTLFDLSCAGSILVEVDCTAEEFHVVCLHVKRICTTSFFAVDGLPFQPFSGSLPASLTVADIRFNSLSDICAAMGICNERDVMNIARRERNIGKRNRAEDAAIRVAGSFLFDPAGNDTPATILVCRGIHEGMNSNETIDVLTRCNQELDPRTVWYAHPLRKETMTLSSLVQYVYKSTSESSYKECLTKMRSDTTCFTLRWRPISNPNAKIWTGKMIRPPDSTGTLEAEIPYVLIRGTRGIEEMKELVTDSYLKCQLR